ncbi:hypothetical protein IC232_31790 [Microvirga sp. BT688]|uniref:hypothetical protein n=1 Tax=Microvirga sp. TaxID=1873136 RepID=UPI0016848780|nr:hypothetical protein [Microvirga sp.]MBD2751216.1 hypothetical protein [Microvirga sp.]
MLEVDIQTKIVPDNQRIWVVFSGRRRQYYEFFALHNMIFLDYAGLNINEQALSSKGITRQHIRMAISLQEYYRSDSSRGVPSSNPNSYDDSPFEEHSSRVMAANVKKLYGEAKVGDLIIVPGTAFQPVLFGEITEPFNPNATVHAPGKDYLSVQYRHVSWLRTDVARVDIPYDLQKYFLKPPAISELPRNPINNRIYSYACSSYILPNVSFAFLAAPNYSGTNPLETLDANILITYFVAAYSAIDRGEIEKFSNLDLYDAITEYYNHELVSSYVQVFRSPGFFSLTAKAALLAAFVSACTTLAMTNISPAQLQQGITISNSASPSRTSEETILQEQIDLFMKSMKEQQLKELKERGRKAKSQLDLRTQAKVK